MRKNIFLKIFLGYLAVLTLVFSATVTSSFKMIRSNYIHTTRDFLKRPSIAVRDLTMPMLENKDLEKLNAYVGDLGRRMGIRITVIDEKGGVLADSEKDPLLMENHGNRPEVASALRGSPKSATRYSTTLKKYMLYYAMPYRSKEHVLGVLRLSIPLNNIDTLLDSLKKRILEVALIVLLISILAGLILSRIISEPVRRLADSFKSNGKWSPGVNVSVESEDEIGELAKGFNTMAERLESSFTEISHQRNELESIISSISEGLLVLDREGKIIKYNKAAEYISDIKDIQGKYYWEAFLSRDLQEFVSKGIGGPSRKEIILKNRTFIVSITPVRPVDLSVVVMHDITELKEMDGLKRDLVTSVSHELRTPLTVIKGFTETLIEENKEKAGSDNKYLSIIKHNTDRLINIVRDLFELSSLEDKESRLNIEDVDLKALIQAVLTGLSEQAKAKGLSLNSSVSQTPVVVRGDAFRLEQLFTNIIDNAIKYTDKGSVDISISSDANYARVEIKDTGIGIPREHLRRIFDRFYVVDKSRSRKLGGTGLGLAIAKHIAELHTGSIEVDSAPYRGTTFTVILPC